ncbi:hypothetical protein [Herbiconiux solani]|uniref:hypothetical protein n=1 Tax=Herbiconiux solani TaxID=661329 RepID=UPI0008267AF1|nr:hypothetical protein [Herbiconiux solani]
MANRTQQFRDDMKAQWEPINAPCAECGQATIDWDGPKNQPDSFELDHKLPRVNYPELEFEPSNARPTHHRCNRHKGAGQTVPDLGMTSEEW